MMKYLLVFWMGVMAACGSSAQGVPGVDPPAAATEAAEPARIRSGRAEADAKYARAERLCYQNFSVNGCLEDARVERRKTLSELSRRERLLNQQVRQAKSTARLDALEKKSAANKARNDQQGTDAGVPRDTARLPALKSAGGDGTGPVHIRQRSEKTSAQAAASYITASGMARHQKKLQQAQQRRAKQEAKQKAKTKPAAASLPVPG